MSPDVRQRLRAALRLAHGVAGALAACLTRYHSFLPLYPFGSRSELAGIRQMSASQRLGVFGAESHSNQFTDAENSPYAATDELAIYLGAGRAEILVTSLCECQKRSAA